MRWIQLTHVGVRAHVKLASRIVSYRTGDGNGEVEPGMADVVLGEAGVTSRVVLVHRVDLE